MNTQILTVTIAAAALILSIFGASWLTQQQLSKLIDQLDKRILGVGEGFDAKLGTVRAEIATLGVKVDALGERVARIERQLDSFIKPALPGGRGQ